MYVDTCGLVHTSPIVIWTCVDQTTPVHIATGHMWTGPHESTYMWTGPHVSTYMWTGPHVSTCMSMYVISQYHNTILAMGFSNHLSQYLAYKTDIVM